MMPVAYKNIRIMTVENNHCWLLRRRVLHRATTTTTTMTKGHRLSLVRLPNTVGCLWSSCGPAFCHSCCCCYRHSFFLHEPIHWRHRWPLSIWQPLRHYSPFGLMSCRMGLSGWWPFGGAGPILTPSGPIDARPSGPGREQSPLSHTEITGSVSSGLVAKLICTLVHKTPMAFWMHCVV